MENQNKKSLKGLWITIAIAAVVLLGAWCAFNAILNPKTDINGNVTKEGVVNGKKITVYPMFGDAYNVPIEEGKGGHGGGDPVLLNDIFGVPEYDPYKRAAGYIDGCMSILTGISANKSMATGMPVEVMSLVDIPGYRKIY